MKKRIRILLPILMMVALLASMFGMALPVAALEPAGVGPAAHGIGIAKSATGPTGQAVALEGQTVNVTITVYSLDNSGDAMNVTWIEDTVYHNSGINSSGNLLPSPVVLYNFGESTTVWYIYVVEAGDNDPLIDNAAAYATDTVTGLPYTSTGGAQIDIVHPCIHIEKTTNGGDGLDIPMGATVTWTYTVTNCGDVPLSNITVTDSHGSVTPAYVSGDDGDNILQTTETWIYQASDNAIEGAYNNTGYVDGYYGTALVQDDDASGYFGANPCIHIEKTTNGGDGLNIPMGDPITWTYTVTNCGNVPLSNITVTDSHGSVTPAYVSGDDADGILQTSETWIFQATGFAVEGTYTNTGYVDGYYGTTLVQANDGSGYFGTNPLIDLEKYVNGDDADSPTGPVVLVGSTVTFTFNVTNTGNIALTNVVVTDNVLGSIGIIPSLAVGASQTLTTTASALAGQNTNVGNVTTNEGATDSDAGNYFGAIYTIDLEKLVNGDDADSPTGPVVAVGSTVTFTFNVTNTGNIALTTVVVNDNVLGYIGTIPSLAVGASQTLTTTASALAGQRTNVGNVTSAEGATDSDPGNYFGATYIIDLEKLVNGNDADSPTGPVVAVGSTVTFTFNVTNTGNIALTTVVVNDNVLGYIGTIPSLAVGASQTLTTTAPALAGQRTNVGNVTSAEGATDSDPGNYFGATYIIDLEKLVNGDDADSPTGPVVAVGSTVTFTFNVTNTGNVALTNVVVTDDVLGNIGNIPSLAVGASQTLTTTTSALAGQHTNVGSVTTDEGATDSDPGNYFGESQQCTGCLKICKFEDKNGNGKKDCGESYLSGWTFNVTDSQGYSQLVTTGSSVGTLCGGCGGGDYCVTVCGLAQGEYTVTETLKAGWICTTGNPRIVTVECDKTTTVTFGNQKPCPGSIKIYKFNDKNGNGKKDWLEPYLSGWVFTVTGPGGYSKVVTTGSGGYVTISGLVAGEYTITETLKAGWICTTGNPRTVTVVSGKTTTVYFGNKKPCNPCG